MYFIISSPAQPRALKKFLGYGGTLPAFGIILAMIIEQ